MALWVHYNGVMPEHKAKSEALNCESTTSLDPAEFSTLAADADLLAVFVSTGDVRSLEILIHRPATMVAGVCRSTVSDNASADDAFQATFLVLLKSAHRIRNRTSLGAWLHGVAYRTACRARKKWRDSLKHSSIDEAASVLEAKEVDPLSQIARRMELETLDEELQNLPRSLRDPLVEHFLLGRTAAEIAEQMELTQSAVEGRIRRGKRRLRERLAQRGVGLSVAVMAAAWFQRQVSAMEGAVWNSRVLENLNHNVDLSIEQNQLHDPFISSLVKQELTMSSSYAIKLSLSAVLLVSMGAICVGWQVGGGSDAGQPSTSAERVTVESLPDRSTPPVVAQMMGGGSGMGGVGMGGMGGTMGRSLPQNFAGAPPVKFAPWEVLEGSPPSWVTDGAMENDRIEAYRKHLSNVLDPDFNGTPLKTVLEQISDDLKVQFWIDQTELDTLGVAVDSPITLSMSTITLRQALKLMLEPLELTYIVRENWIEITSRDKAESDPRIAYYELSYILPDGSHIPSLMMSIEQQIDPDSWLSAGGASSITYLGSLMMVSAPEVTHEKIDSFLGRLVKTSRKNLSATPAFGSVVPWGIGVNPSPSTDIPNPATPQPTCLKRLQQMPKLLRPSRRANSIRKLAGLLVETFSRLG